VPADAIVAGITARRLTPLIVGFWSQATGTVWCALLLLVLRPPLVSGQISAGLIAGLAGRGVDLFRLNLSHTPLEAVEPTIRRVRELCSVPICLDTEGAQVRCGRVAGGTATLEPGQRVRLVADEDPGGTERLQIKPRATFATLRPGSTLQVDFDGVVLRIAEVGEDSAESVVVEGGRVSSNRAVIVDPAPVLPTLTDKDLAAIEEITPRGSVAGERYTPEHMANVDA
jgi:pyruvate kinase